MKTSKSITSKNIKSRKEYLNTNSVLNSLTRGERIVLRVLINLSRGKKEIYSSQTLIAKLALKSQQDKIGYSRQQVNSIIAKLVTKKLITKRYRHRRTCFYEISVFLKDLTPINIKGGLIIYNTLDSKEGRHFSKEALGISKDFPLSRKALCYLSSLPAEVATRIHEQFLKNRTQLRNPEAVLISHAAKIMRLRNLEFNLQRYRSLSEYHQVDSKQVFFKVQVTPFKEKYELWDDGSWRIPKKKEFCLRQISNTLTSSYEKYVSPKKEIPTRESIHLMRKLCEDPNKKECSEDWFKAFMEFGNSIADRQQKELDASLKKP
jgi:hypothetical protein